MLVLWGASHSLCPALLLTVAPTPQSGCSCTPEHITSQTPGQSLPLIGWEGLVLRFSPVLSQVAWKDRRKSWHRLLFNFFSLKSANS